MLTRAEPPRSSYLPPQSRNQFNNAPSNQYGAPNNGFTSQSQSQPRTNYGAPSNSRTNYAAPQQPKSQYGPPQQQQQSFNQQQSYDLPLEQDFGNNFQQSAPASSYGVPSQAYGAPGSGNSFSDSYTAGGQGNNQGAYEEPAKYEFQYDVQDEPAGLDFGHQEKREGSVATGKYYVLLPDGRKQVSWKKLSSFSCEKK